MMVELQHFAFAIDKVLCKVPLNLSIRKSCSQVLVQGTHIAANHIDFAQQRKGDSKWCSDPLWDLLLWPGLFVTKLVAGVAKDLESSPTMRLIHFLVLAIVWLGQASDRGNVDDYDCFGISSDSAQRHFIWSCDLPNRNVEKGSRRHLYLSNILL